MNIIYDKYLSTWKAQETKGSLFLEKEFQIIYIALMY